jgi:hypothetical protein
MEKCLLVDSALYNTARTTQKLLAVFWTPAYWPVYFQDLNPLDFSLWHILPVKVQAMPQANLIALCLFNCHQMWSG